MGSGETAQLLRELATLTEDTSSAPRSPIVIHYDLKLQPMHPSDLCRHQHRHDTHTYTYAK